MLLVLFALACATPDDVGSGDSGKSGGGGGQPQLVLGPDVLDFGLVIAGSEQERIISVRNEGGAAADLTVRLEVDLPQAFRVSPETLTVEADDYENVTFTFMPAAWAIFDGSAHFEEDGVALASAELSIEVMADRDDDGWGADRHGGGDCDDDDPDVNPESEDTWYDGIDSNCDGASDFDADQDGFDAEGGEGELDCDDDDPDRSPGAEEVWYDGVDTDCADDDDYDADADGDRAAAHGGTDCLDDDPRLAGLDTAKGCLAGAEDAVARAHALSGAGDTVALTDLDGDGQVDLLAGGAGLGLVVALGPLTGAMDLTAGTAWTGDGARTLSLTDLDGDEDPDALLVDDRAGAVRLLRGPLTAGGTLAGAATKLRTPGRTDLPLAAAGVGDLDGDGIPDVAVGWSGRSSLPGLPPAAMLFLDDDAVRDALLLGPPGSAAGASLLGPGDLDGDGMDDLLVGAPGGDGQVWLVPGPITEGQQLSDETARLQGTPDAGLGSALAWADGAVWVQQGASWHRVEGDWAGTVVPATSGITGEPSGVLAIGDADADGSADALVGLPGADSVAWLPALEGYAGTAPLVLQGGGASGLGFGAASGDLDGDGHVDLLLAAPGLGASLWLPGPVLTP